MVPRDYFKLKWQHSGGSRFNPNPLSPGTSAWLPTDCAKGRLRERPGDRQEREA